MEACTSCTEEAYCRLLEETCTLCSEGDGGEQVPDMLRRVETCQMEGVGGMDVSMGGSPDEAYAVDAGYGRDALLGP